MSLHKETPAQTEVMVQKVVEGTNYEQHSPNTKIFQT